MAIWSNGDWIIVDDATYNRVKGYAADWVKSESQWVRENLPKTVKAVPKAATGLGKLGIKFLGGIVSHVIGEALFPETVSDGKLPQNIVDTPLIPDNEPLKNPDEYEPISPIYSNPEPWIVKPILMPPRRLKPLVQSPDTQPIGTVAIPSVTVEKAMGFKVWGEILVPPTSGTSYKIKKANFDKYLEGLEDDCKKAERRLSDWLLNKEFIAFDDQAIVFIDILDYKSGEKRIDAVPGLKQIQSLYEAFYLASKAANHRPIVSTIPKEVEFEDVSIENLAYTPVNHNYMNTRGGPAARASGESSYPVALPNSMVDDKNDVAIIRNNAEAFAYLVKYIDSVIGRFPVEIEIEDNDLLQSGNQRETLKLPNIAETLAELSGLALSGQAHAQAQTNLALKTIIQTCKNSVGIAVNQDHLRAIADYAGFQSKEIKREMVIPITPGTDEFEDALQISTQQYESIELTDKKDLNTYLATLLQAAAIIKAVNFKKLKGGDIKTDIKNYLQTIKEAAEGSSDEDWKQFINEFETGFATHPVRDNQHPYGQNIDERPRVRDLGKIK